VTEKKGKVPVFIEDILMEPAIKRLDVRQMMPKLPPAEVEQRAPDEHREDVQLFPAAAEPAKIFSRIADWAEEFHPPSPEPLTLSPSALSGYRTCPQRYLFGYLWSLREGPKAAMTFGAVMHTTIKRFVDQLRKGVKLSFDEVQGIFETEWNSKGFEDQYQEEEYKKDGLEQLRAFHTGMIAELPQAVGQEKAFELPLDNNVIIKGRIDQINALGDRKSTRLNSSHEWNSYAVFCSKQKRKELAGNSRGWLTGEQGEEGAKMSDTPDVSCQPSSPRGSSTDGALYLSRLAAAQCSRSG